MEHLKKFFTISVAAFEFQRTIAAALGHKPMPSEMEMLHRMALTELQKPTPDASVLDVLLANLEKVADENSKK